MKTLTIRYAGNLYPQKVVASVEDAEALFQAVAARDPQPVQLTDLSEDPQVAGSSLLVRPDEVASLRSAEYVPSGFDLPPLPVDSSRSINDELDERAVRQARRTRVGDRVFDQTGRKVASNVLLERIPRGAVPMSVVEQLGFEGVLPADPAHRREIEKALVVDEGWLD